MRRLLLALVLASGCASDPCAGIDGACLALTVDGEGEVDTLQIELSGAATGTRVAPAAATLRPLPVHVAVTISHLGRGALHVAVAGFRLGASVGRGEVDVTLAAGEHGDATVVLGGAANPPPEDLGAPPPRDLGCDVAHLQDDRHNCGRCGHDCLGGPCLSGRCGPAVLATGQQQTEGLAVAGSNLYWILWRDNGARQADLRKLPLEAGGAPTTIYSGPHDPGGLATDGNNLYWTDTTRGTLVRFPLPAGPPTDVVTGETAPRALHADGTDLFWSAADLNLVRAPTADPSSVLPFLTAGSPIRGIVSDGTYVFWTQDDGRVMRQSLVGLVSPSEVTFGQPSPWGIAVDSDAIYWANPFDGSIVAWSRTSRSRQSIATGQQQPRALTVDAGAVYWVSYNEAAIYRVAKPPR